MAKAKPKTRAKTNPIRLGIVGLGRAGFRMQCREIAEREDKFQIVAGCDVLASKRQRMAERHPACAIYSRIEDLLADPNIELVSVATRSIDHFPHAMMALKAGKHVFLEKPMCIDYAQAKKLKAMAEKAKGNLYIRQNRRFDPEFLHVREIINSGVLGEIRQIKLSRTSYSRRDDWQTIRRFGGGDLSNNGPHPIDQALQLLGAPKKPLRKICGHLQLISSVGDAEDQVKIILVGATGCLVDIEVGNGAAVAGPACVVRGTRGGLSCSRNTMTLRYLDPKKKLKPRPLNAGDPGDTFGSREELPWIEKTLEIAPKTRPNIWDEVYKAIRLRKKFPIAVDEAVEVIRVITEVRKGSAFPSPTARR